VSRPSRKGLEGINSNDDSRAADYVSEITFEDASLMDGVVKPSRMLRCWFRMLLPSRKELIGSLGHWVFAADPRKGSSNSEQARHVTSGIASTRRRNVRSVLGFPHANRALRDD